MAGVNSNGGGMGDWMPPSPTSRNFFSNLMVDEIDLKQYTNGNGGPSLKSKEGEKRGETVVDVKVEECGDGGGELSTDLAMKAGSVNSHKPSFTERRAARAGFSAPKIDTEQIRSSNFASSTSDIRSPYVTIPPGLSPTTLLDSPVFLSNSMALPSPTTGTFPFTQFGFPFAQFGLSNQFSSSASLAPDKRIDQHLEGINSESSDVKFSNPFSFSRVIDQPVPTVDPQNSKERNISNDLITNHSLLNANPTTAKEYSSPPEEEETKGESSLALGAPAEDGYNWRKYGQKHVKGSEYPRSYYKCTHTNCPVKKKVERNHEGQVTEIVYKGAHNHPKPTPNRRTGVPLSRPFIDYQIEGHDWRNDTTYEAMPLASGGTEYCENQEAGEVSSTLSNEEDDDRATHGSISACCDGEGEESESKRRKLDDCAVEMGTGSRTVREPRVVVQTTSEVDILDDGYRWRKYGQKVVKGNPNPRSYYKCTHPGCLVRKHVERASHDLKSVITTYEGKHNHEVPAARSGSGQTSSTPPTSTPPSVSQPSRRSQESFARYDATSAPLPPYGAAPGGNFSFSVGPQGLTMSRFGSMTLPPINSYLGHRNPVEAGLVVPKGEPKEESGSDMNMNMNVNMNMNMANGSGSVYYHQLMNRMLLE